MTYIAHTNDQKEEQSIKNHLRGTAALAGSFAAAFGCRELGELTGLAHDIGKYSEDFQRRIRGDALQVDHSTAGAKELWSLGMKPAAMCVAGHHGGLPDLGTRAGSEGERTLWGRIQSPVPDYSGFCSEVFLKPVSSPSISDPFEMAFFIRMLFSCLVDADFLDTERFMQTEPPRRGEYGSLPEILNRLHKHIEKWWESKREIDERRCEILRACLDAGREEKGLFTLTVPTGGGKTVSSLAFALEHAVRHGMSRIVYVIPYTSIIEQTADVFREIAGKENVLEHHANVDFDREGDLLAEQHRLASENWDVPIVVTTNVQFFESLYSNKTSRCRKLHNLANSVIIFDEAQMLPLPYLLPCVRAVTSLVKSYGVSAVLCTATQPSLGKFFPADLKIRELCPEREAMYRFFRRTSLCRIGTCSREEIARRMAEHQQALSVVGTRKQAYELFSGLPEEGRFHLSTLMHPEHRRNVLKEIRERLRAGKTCRVAATSLIEAGVDVDFPVVFRAEAGLDSIIQAAGRCNREGTRPAKESFVYIFTPEEKPPLEIQTCIGVLHEIEDAFPDIASPEAIEAYFDALHDIRGGGLDRKGIVDMLEYGYNGGLCPLKHVAEEFRLIESDMRQVFIPKEKEAETLLAEYRDKGPSRSLMRRMGAYMVDVHERHFEELIRSGCAEQLEGDLAALCDLKLYSDETGLSLRAEGGRAWML